MQTLVGRDNLPSSLANSATAEALDAVLECAVMSKNSRRSSCQKDSEGTDGFISGAMGRAQAEQIAVATRGAVHINVV